MHTHIDTHMLRKATTLSEKIQSHQGCADIVMAMRQCGNERLWAGRKDCGQIGEIVGSSGRLCGSQGDCGRVRDTVGRSTRLLRDHRDCGEVRETVWKSARL